MPDWLREYEETIEAARATGFIEGSPEDDAASVKFQDMHPVAVAAMRFAEAHERMLKVCPNDDPRERSHRKTERDEALSAYRAARDAREKR